MKRTMRPGFSILTIFIKPGRGPRTPQQFFGIMRRWGAKRIIIERELNDGDLEKRKRYVLRRQHAKYIERSRRRRRF